MHKCNFRFVARSVMTSQIQKFVDFTKTQKSRQLENKTLLQIKKSLITFQELLDGKKSFCAGGYLQEQTKNKARLAVPQNIRTKCLGQSFLK